MAPANLNHSNSKVEEITETIARISSSDYFSPRMEDEELHIADAVDRKTFVRWIVDCKLVAC